MLVVIRCRPNSRFAIAVSLDHPIIAFGTTTTGEVNFVWFRTDQLSNLRP